MGRRGRKEYRAPEALQLIALDRDSASLVCPSCGAAQIARQPRRRMPPGSLAPHRVTLRCEACGRHAEYIPRPADVTVGLHAT